MLVMRTALLVLVLVAAVAMGSDDHADGECYVIAVVAWS